MVSEDAGVEADCFANLQNWRSVLKTELTFVIQQSEAIACLRQKVKGDKSIKPFLPLPWGTWWCRRQKPVLQGQKTKQS